MLELVKAKLGISSSSRDAVLTSIIGEVETYFSDILKLDITKWEDLASELVVHRYSSKGEQVDIPKHLMRRIRDAQLKYQIDNGNISQTD